MHSNRPAQDELDISEPEKYTTTRSSSPSQQDPNLYSQHEKPALAEGRDLEVNGRAAEERKAPQSMFKSLGILDRFLAVWIFLAMAVGIILGALVDSVGPALQKGEFVGVSVPIGMLRTRYPGWND